MNQRHLQVARPQPSAGIAVGSVCAIFAYGHGDQHLARACWLGSPINRALTLKHSSKGRCRLPRQYDVEVCSIFFFPLFAPPAFPQSYLIVSNFIPVALSCVLGPGSVVCLPAVICRTLDRLGMELKSMGMSRAGRSRSSGANGLAKVRIILACCMSTLFSDRLPACYVKATFGEGTKRAPLNRRISIRCNVNL